MPESGFARSLWPPQATECLPRVLGKSLVDPPHVIDLSHSFPDSDFIDLNHLDAHGRELFTIKLRDILRIK